jgi:hypothetical protein
MTTYLDPTDDGAFQDMSLKPIPPDHFSQHPVRCPRCDGHGGWNLRLDAYGEGKHFQAGCFQCNGWGWVDAHSKDATCVHDYQEVSYSDCLQQGIPHYGQCWHVYQCTKCGARNSCDSSG